MGEVECCCTFAAIGCRPATGTGRRLAAQAGTSRLSLWVRKPCFGLKFLTHLAPCRGAVLPRTGQNKKSTQCSSGPSFFCLRYFAMLVFEMKNDGTVPDSLRFRLSHALDFQNRHEPASATTQGRPFHGDGPATRGSMSASLLAQVSSLLSPLRSCSVRDHCPCQVENLNQAGLHPGVSGCPPDTVSALRSGHRKMKLGERVVSSVA